MRLRHILAAAVLLSAGLAARADDLFTLTNGSTVITFTIPASPSVFTWDADSFSYRGITVMVNGTTTVKPYETFFYDLTDGGGIELSNILATIGTDDLVDQQGPILFTGSTSAPTFIPGSYNLTNYSGTTNTYNGDFSLTISGGSVTSPTGVTPEPSSFLLMGTGLLGLAATLKRRLA